MKYRLEHEWVAPKGYPPRLLEEAAERFTAIIAGYLADGFVLVGPVSTEIQGQTIIMHTHLEGPADEAFDERNAA